VAALVWSWKIIHSEPNVSFETHSGIQERLTDLIQNTIKASKPSAANIHIEQIWTEVVTANKLKAHFKYSFHEQGESGPLTTQIVGEGLLERQPDDGSDNDRWTLSKVHTTNDSIVFEDGLLVTGDRNAEKPETKETEPKKDE
jgi:hypothetical protein